MINQTNFFFTAVLDVLKIALENTKNLDRNSIRRESLIWDFVDQNSSILDHRKV